MAGRTQDTSGIGRIHVSVADGAYRADTSSNGVLILARTGRGGPEFRRIDSCAKDFRRSPSDFSEKGFGLAIPPSAGGGVSEKRRAARKLGGDKAGAVFGIFRKAARWDFMGAVRTPPGHGIFLPSKILGSGSCSRRQNLKTGNSRGLFNGPAGKGRGPPRSRPSGCRAAVLPAGAYETSIAISIA